MLMDYWFKQHQRCSTSSMGLDDLHEYYDIYYCTSAERCQNASWRMWLLSGRTYYGYPQVPQTKQLSQIFPIWLMLNHPPRPGAKTHGFLRHSGFLAGNFPHFGEGFMMGLPSGRLWRSLNDPQWHNHPTPAFLSAWLAPLKDPWLNQQTASSSVAGVAWPKLQFVSGTSRWNFHAAIMVGSPESWSKHGMLPLLDVIILALVKCCCDVSQTDSQHDHC